MSATDTTASAGGAKAPTEVKPFVVGQASSLSAQELNRFRIHNEGIVRSVGARLSLFLRAEFAFDLEHLDAMELGRYATKAEPIGNYLLFQVDRVESQTRLRLRMPKELELHRKSQSKWHKINSWHLSSPSSF